jgi:hypothetical protein
MWSRCRGMGVRLRGETTEGYSATIRIGHLVFQLSGLQIKDRPRMEVHGRLAQVLISIWPIWEPVTWPPSRGLNQHGVETLTSMIEAHPMRTPRL